MRARQPTHLLCTCTQAKGILGKAAWSTVIVGVVSDFIGAFLGAVIGTFPYCRCFPLHTDHAFQLLCLACFTYRVPAGS